MAPTTTTIIIFLFFLMLWHTLLDFKLTKKNV